MSAIVSGATVAALATGLVAGLAFESRQVQPHVLHVQHQGPPGPALIEKLEASAGSANLATHAALESVPDGLSNLDGRAITSNCGSDATPQLAMDAVLCTLSSVGPLFEPLLEPLLAGNPDG